MIQKILTFCKAYSAKCIGALFGAIFSLWHDNIAFIVTCTALVLYDCVEAYKLCRRMKKTYGPEVADGKFKSYKFGKVVKALGFIYSVILLAFAIQKHVLYETPLINIPVIIGAAICAWYGISILENGASCNGQKWAILALRILEDKSERHIHIPLEDFRRIRNEKFNFKYKDYERRNKGKSDVSNDVDGQV